MWQTLIARFRGIVVWGINPWIFGSLTRVLFSKVTDLFGRWTELYHSIMFWKSDHNSEVLRSVHNHANGRNSEHVLTIKYYIHIHKSNVTASLRSTVKHLKVRKCHK